MPLHDVGKARDPLSPNASPPRKSIVSDERLFEVATAFYNHMFDGSKYVANDSDDVVWEGSMSRWFKENQLTHLYSPVTKLLYKAGCCNIVSRGGGTKPSLVKLNHEPTLKEVTTLRENDFFFEKETMTKKGREMRVEQMVTNHRAQIADLLERVERLERGKSDYR